MQTFSQLEERVAEADEEKEKIGREWDAMRLRGIQQDEQQANLAKTLASLDEKEMYLQKQFSGIATTVRLQIN